MLRIMIILASLLLSAYDTTSQSCEQDYKKICEKSDETKSNCLQDNFDKVMNKECKKELESVRTEWQKKGESFKKVKISCAKEVEKNCPEDKDSRKNYTVCLMMHGDKLSVACKNEANRHIKDFLPGLNPIK